MFLQFQTLLCSVPHLLAHKTNRRLSAVAKQQGNQATRISAGIALETTMDTIRVPDFYSQEAFDGEVLHRNDMAV